ncbi:hypothetical protein M2139_001257 [Enterococcus sp. PF1-24]|uniref:hypothetical protein n=1 Tax=unclassified Enterococcus TaxID=2608891 RepID=UPI0024763776|nr:MULTISPECIES: hypothetical protein [unclassified Enterococcus]MDH6364268.1 hypothetical protein [Enterococcus sp. PFB1-1]MDH6401373.1 hypothetical protein [Enterococcus sp. PF1-24]
MRPYWPKDTEPSELGQTFTVNQEVSFIYKSEIHVGLVEKMLKNSAIIILYNENFDKENQTKLVISYSKLLPVFKQPE